MGGTYGSQQSGLSGGGGGQQGGLGGGGGQGKRGGVSFEVVMGRLRGELQKSKETGVELQGIAGCVGEAVEVLRGGLVSQVVFLTSFVMRFVMFRIF